MAALLRHLVSVLAHVFWTRSGRRGPLPPLRVPGRRTTHLPVPSPWQIMAASWALERLWQAFGPKIKGRMTQSPTPLVHKIGDLLPGPADTTTMPPAPTASAASTTPSAAMGPSAMGPVVTSAPGAATQPLPSGSVLRSLRSSHLRSSH